MSHTGDSPGGTFETLPLTPPRPNSSKSDDGPSSPRFPRPPRIRTERDSSSPLSHALLSPSPLGSPVAAHANANANQALLPPGEARSRLVNSSSAPSERDYRAFARSSSFNKNGGDSQSRILNSPRAATDKPTVPIYSRVGSLKSASLSRNISGKDGAALHTLDRLLSMEKGENWKEEGNRNVISYGNGEDGSELNDEILENSQYEGISSFSKIWKHGTPVSKKLFALITLTFAYSATEFLIGLLTGRIGLVSDSFHLTFGCGVLTFSLFAMVMSKSRPDEKYTYGYSRLEVLAAFTNALFLLFLSFTLAVEALHAFIQDEEEHKHYLIVSAVANLIVNLLGVWFFRSYARVRVVYRKAEDMNNHSICLHVLSDSIRSAGVVLASWLLTLGIKYAETLCLGLVAVAVFLTAMPLFKASGGVLLQMAPPGISRSAFSKCERQVVLLEEVIDCCKARFWDIVPGSVVGTVVLLITADSDEQKILKHVHSIYNDIGVKDLTIQLEVKHESGG